MNRKDSPNDYCPPISSELEKTTKNIVQNSKLSKMAAVASIIINIAVLLLILALAK